MAKKQKIKIDERTKKIIYLMSEGFNDNEIAESLGLTASGLRYYIREIFITLNLSSRCQLISWGFRNGVLK